MTNTYKKIKNKKEPNDLFRQTVYLRSPSHLIKKKKALHMHTH